MASDSLHEPRERIAASTVELHRGLTSLIEELEAVDWYGQRADACDDDELKSILLHNRAEEIEHACMALEWIRRRDPGFDTFLREFLFRQGPIVRQGPSVREGPTVKAHVEEDQTGARPNQLGAARDANESGTARKAHPAGPEPAGLRIGSLKTTGES